MGFQCRKSSSHWLRSASSVEEPTSQELPQQAPRGLESDPEPAMVSSLCTSHVSTSLFPPQG